MSVRPVVGILACTRDLGPEIGQLVVGRYVEATARFAKAAVLIVPALPDLMRAEDIAERIDGLLLTGSASNIAPARYGEADTNNAEGPFDLARDEMAIALIDAMVAKSKPIFAMCRGLQELNVAFGGTLHRNLNRLSPESLQHHAPADWDIERVFAHQHPVRLVPGGVIHRQLGRELLSVNSAHYQGIDRLGRGLDIEARAPDGIIEAVSSKANGSWILAVQWHPEWDTPRNQDSLALFGLFGRVLRDELKS